MSADPTIGEIDMEKLTFVRKFLYFRHLISNGASNLGFRFFEISETAPRFLETLILARDFSYTDLRDKIYALWNLAKDKKDLSFGVDYSRSVQGVYMDFARAWIDQHRSLDILGAVEIAAPNSPIAQEAAPSWSPDWSQASSSSCLVRRERIPSEMMAAVSGQDGELYSAEGGMKRDSVSSPLFEFDGEVICCTGIIVDQIDHILPPPPGITISTCIPPWNPPTYHAFWHWMATIAIYFSGRPDLATYDDPLQAATAMFHGDTVVAWPPAAEKLADVNEKRNEKYVCNPQIARHVTGRGESYRRGDAYDAIKAVVRGRRPFISEQGYMGLAPSYIDQDESGKPWLLAIVATCSVPLLLQEREDGSYRVCGTCFVQGWMEGEVLTSQTSWAQRHRRNSGRPWWEGRS
jgi:hypothetical protein